MKPNPIPRLRFGPASVRGTPLHELPLWDLERKAEWAAAIGHPQAGELAAELLRRRYSRRPVQP